MQWMVFMKRFPGFRYDEFAKGCTAASMALAAMGGIVRNSLDRTRKVAEYYHRAELCGVDRGRAEAILNEELAAASRHVHTTSDMALDKAARRLAMIR